MIGNERNGHHATAVQSAEYELVSTVQVTRQLDSISRQLARIEERVTPVQRRPVRPLRTMRRVHVRRPRLYWLRRLLRVASDHGGNLLYGIAGIGVAYVAAHVVLALIRGI